MGRGRNGGRRRERPPREDDEEDLALSDTDVGPSDEVDDANLQLGNVCDGNEIDLEVRWLADKQG